MLGKREESTIKRGMATSYYPGDHCTATANYNIPVPQARPGYVLLPRSSLRLRTKT